ADSGQIEQIIMNLGVNARDAMPDGGTLIFKSENITLDREYFKSHIGSSPGEYVLLSVSDTGHGMDKEVMERIFEPFFTTKKTGKGTGLGMAMVYGIVESHNGYITCDSKIGQGSSFNIYFPVIEEEVEVVDLEKEEVPIRRGNETILLVDDDENIRQSASEIMINFGYKVLTAVDGETSLEIYQNEFEKISLVILDLIMPGMGGRRCLEKLIEINPHVQVIIASGYSEDVEAREWLEKHAQGFIDKPYEFRQLLNMIREVLNGN
ncbi:MAG: ATP-binding protein, partial [Thermodesulfobacteriota bacterium]|nr:ATP-binding protein [Thermodesulfobacteriota bacterium]